MPSIAHKFSPVDCSVSNAFLCFFLSGAVLKYTNRVFLPWTRSQNARRKNSYKIEMGKKKHTTNHQSVMSIWFESSLDILKETPEQISNKRKTRYVSACCNTFTEFLANIFGLNKVLIKYMKKLKSLLANTGMWNSSLCNPKASMYRVFQFHHGMKQNISHSINKIQTPKFGFLFFDWRRRRMVR